MGLARIPGPLLLITDRRQARKPLEEVIAAALTGGCRWVSVREKDLPDEERKQFVLTLLPLVRRFGGTLLVHGDVNASVYADGVHLPAGGSVREARARLGEKACIGLSCHTLEDVQEAAGADYVTLGPIAPTLSKPGYLPILTFEQLAEASTFGIPVIALGGVDETNVGEVRRGHAAGFALMGSVMRSEDPEGLVRRVLERWSPPSMTP
ncbi:MAG TPA: thiamine phosphate synthase [Polyangium sp.]|nr:thiamine phosphate synthase [Polyangium sp.]